MTYDRTEILRMFPISSNCVYRYQRDAYVVNGLWALIQSGLAAPDGVWIRLTPAGIAARAELEPGVDG